MGGSDVGTCVVLDVEVGVVVYAVEVSALTGVVISQVGTISDYLSIAPSARDGAVVGVISRVIVALQIKSLWQRKSSSSNRRGLVITSHNLEVVCGGRDSETGCGMGKTRYLCIQSKLYQIKRNMDKRVMEVPSVWFGY